MYVVLSSQSMNSGLKYAHKNLVLICGIPDMRFSGCKRFHIRGIPDKRDSTVSFLT